MAKTGRSGAGVYKKIKRNRFLSIRAINMQQLTNLSLRRSQRTEIIISTNIICHPQTQIKLRSPPEKQACSGGVHWNHGTNHNSLPKQTFTSQMEPNLSSEDGRFF